MKTNHRALRNVKASARHFLSGENRFKRRFVFFCPSITGGLFFRKPLLESERFQALLKEK